MAMDSAQPIDILIAMDATFCLANDSPSSTSPATSAPVSRSSAAFHASWMRADARMLHIHATCDAMRA